MEQFFPYQECNYHVSPRRDPETKLPCNSPLILVTVPKGVVEEGEDCHQPSLHEES